MSTGAITGYIDVAQLVLYGFWIFFAGLVLYLRREDKREGYPLEIEDGRRGVATGYPSMPKPKRFWLTHGGTKEAPDGVADTREIRARLLAGWPGSALVPTGDPMQDGVGPAAYANRADVPDRTFEGAIRMVPMRTSTLYHVESRDPDPRGMNVVGADGMIGGVVCDLWIDQSEPQVRYLEVETKAASGIRRVLLPINYTKIDGRRRQVNVQAVLARHFAEAPGLQHPDQVTLREEDRITAYYAGGKLYAEPSRLGPLL
jgi:photosynthetic reaction center H subunit